jgi:hypothetical protein
MPAAIAAGGFIRVPLVDPEESGMFTLGSRPGRVLRVPRLVHTASLASQLDVVNRLFSTTC